MYGYSTLEHQNVSSELQIDEDTRFEIQRYNAFVRKISQNGKYSFIFNPNRWEIVCDNLNKNGAQSPEQEVAKSRKELHEMDPKYFKCSFKPEDLYDKNWFHGVGSWIRDQGQLYEITGPMNFIREGGLIMI